MSKQLIVVGALLVVVGLFQATGSAAIIVLDADPTELTDLLEPGATITVEDKQFSAFQYMPTGDMPPASGVQVYRIRDDVTGNVGIRFQGLFKDMADPTNAGSDAVIQFDVEALDPSQYIADVHLFANVNSSTNSLPPSFGEVVEDIFPENSPNSVKLFVDEVNRSRNLVLADHGIAPQRAIHVLKDIGLYSHWVDGVSEPNDRVTISVVDQLISQVPEPAGFGVMVGLLLGFLGYVRRHR